MNKEYRKISELKNWDKNPRAIKKEDFERLKKQVKELGEYKPLLITSDGIVLGGNMRLKAYQDMGMDKVWVSVVDPKTEAEKVKYALSDNDRAGYYVDQELAELITEYGAKINLEDYKVDLGQALSLADVLNQFAPDVEEDEPPAVAKGEADSKLGEVYQLGKHRLMCGDATKIEDVEKLMDGKKADMVFTDPPYNADYSGRGQNNLGKIENDNQSDADFELFIKAFLPNLITNTKAGGCYYICCNWKDSYPRFFFNCKDAGITISANIIWNKGSGGMGWQDYRYSYEFILYGFTEGHKWYGDRAQTDIWDFNRDGRQTYSHPTQKPVNLSARAINNSSKQDDIVLDLFGGSGSTLIACEQTNRTCYMMELDPKYCDVIRKRFDNFVNKK